MSKEHQGKRPSCGGVRRTRPLAVTAGLLLGCFGAHAQSVIFYENFNVGLGSFTPTGMVNGGATGASMHGRVQGSSWITSPAINTIGRTNLTLTWTQMCLNSDAGEGCAVLYSTNNINWNLLYTTPYAPFNSPATVTLPAAANNQSQLRLRFQRVANSFEEVYDVDNIALTAGSTGGGGCTGAPATLPTPTVALLEGNAGPLATSTYVVPNPSGYGSGTVTYPTNGSCYPGVILMPGYQGTQQNLQWMGPRLASWGFTVINVGTFTLSDDPNSRGTQIRNAGTHLLSLSAAAGNPISNKVKGVTSVGGLGVSGHSMGGGGTMVALRDDPRFTAGASLAPYYPNGNFSSVTKPTFFLVCASDPVAGGNMYAKPWYNSMGGAEKLYMNVPGDHLCPMTGYGNKAKQGKYLVAWFSRWLKGDTNYSQFLCNDSIRNVDRNNPSIVTEWMDTCAF